jgi:hypothetical protein
MVNLKIWFNVIFEFKPSGIMELAFSFYYVYSIIEDMGT